MTSCPPILVLTTDAPLVTFLRQEYCGSVLSLSSADEGLTTSDAALILVDRDMVLLEQVQRTYPTVQTIFIQGAEMPHDAGLNDAVYAILRHPLPQHSTGLLLKRLALAAAAQTPEPVASMEERRVSPPAQPSDHEPGENGYEGDTPIEQQALELILRKEEDLNQQKYRFMTMVAHEFRTPLTIISSASEMMEHFWNELTEEEERGYLDKIRETVLHLKRILTQIEGVIHTNFQTLVFFPTEFDLIDLCEEIIQRVSQRTRLPSKSRIVFTTRDMPRRVRLDKEKVSIIIEQLLLNALKFSSVERPVLLTLSMQKHNLIIEVRDEGIGIPAEDVDHIYELFFQGSNIGAIGGKGRGMGLKFVRDSVRAHDGRIEVQSSLNKGTTFTVTLPWQPIKRIQ